MRFVIAGLRRVAKLFVDDSRFAFAIVAWVAMEVWLPPRLPGVAGWAPVLLFGGLAAILLVGAHHAARMRRAAR
jgi:hypothetical protein